MRSILLLVCALCFASPALAQVASSPTPLPQVVSIQTIAAQNQAASSIDAPTLISEVVSVVGDIKGGVPVGLKIAGIVLLIIATFKVSFLAPLWQKLGNFQGFAAPILGLILGLCLYGVQGGLGLASVFAYLASGTGALALHELLDAIKAIPGLGTTYVSIINAIESVLGGGNSTPTA